MLRIYRSTITPAYIKAQLNKNPNSYFFSRGTMKFFGDTMRSFGTFNYEGQVYLYRKPNAMVKGFTGWRMAGKENAHIWKYRTDYQTGVSDLHSVDRETSEMLKRVVLGL